MDYIQIITITSTVIIIIGGIYTLRQQIRQSSERNQSKIIETIRQEINPIKMTVEKDGTNINDLWKDLEALEDHLNKLQIEVARHSGVIDLQTPLIVEIRNQIETIRTKIETISTGLK